jgi:DNA-directed RNA polymerase subunit M/transcription elongation factor TFIIS
VVIEVMKFCPDCDNIIFPKKQKFYCKACDKEFDLDAEADDFKIVKKIKHDEKETAPIVVKETLASVKISARDRKAYEEFFELSGAEDF